MTMSLARTEPDTRRFDEATYIDFLIRREDEDGRWELIEGIPIQMPPATMRHGRIASNLERLLSAVLARAGSSHDGRREAGVRYPLADFRPVADVAIIIPRQEMDDCDERFYDECLLIAEVLSPSTEHYDLIWKLPLYQELPDCRYILMISQHEFAMRFYSRNADWVERSFRSPDDLIDLPEFGFSCRLGDLYRGTPIFSEWQRNS
ncbi:MAG: Uma2 family endonuclease [Rhizobiaceae bacterium]|nr:Uma2 family endonuclease [Rhizobiaceae bacterium]